MSVFLLCFLIALWTLILIQTHYLFTCLIALIFVIGIFLLSQKQPNIRLPKIFLISSKVILAISFWSCVAFCLFSYEKSIACTNCIREHLRQTDLISAINLQTLWASYSRFITIIGLFILWVITFVLITKKRINAND